MKWSGDVDLNDGCLQRDYDAYQHRIEQIKKIGLSDQSNVFVIKAMFVTS